MMRSGFFKGFSLGPEPWCLGLGIVGLGFRVSRWGVQGLGVKAYWFGFRGFGFRVKVQGSSVLGVASFRKFSGSLKTVLSIQCSPSKARGGYSLAYCSGIVDQLLSVCGSDRGTHFVDLTVRRAIHALVVC